MTLRSILTSAAIAAAATLGWAAKPPTAPAAATPPAAQPGSILVELFTSEGCSSCPPADALLARLNREPLPGGKRVVGLSEHITYWNNLGWADPYSAAIFTDRQNAYGARFGLASVYTPQAVISGRTQVVGSDAAAVRGAIAQAEADQPVHLQVLAAHVTGHTLTLRYSAQAAQWSHPVELMAVVADDSDRSQVLRGENSGRLLDHVNVARTLQRVGRLNRNTEQTVSVVLPDAAFVNPAVGHTLVLFAQSGAGPVLGADAVPLSL